MKGCIFSMKRSTDNLSNKHNKNSSNILHILVKRLYGKGMVSKIYDQLPARLPYSFAFIMITEENI